MHNNESEKTLRIPTGLDMKKLHQSFVEIKVRGVLVIGIIESGESEFYYIQRPLVP